MYYQVKLTLNRIKSKMYNPNGKTLKKRMYDKEISLSCLDRKVRVKLLGY